MAIAIQYETLAIKAENRGEIIERFNTKSKSVMVTSEHSLNTVNVTTTKYKVIEVIKLAATDYRG